MKDGGRFVLGGNGSRYLGKIDDPKRLVRILQYLIRVYELAMDGGVQAFERMYDNGKKHILNDGEYCIGMSQWKTLP